ncbi:MAG: hypothetical protein NXI24_24630 [bacterium]|nr:hypothetical protein [bacterium]
MFISLRKLALPLGFALLIQCFPAVSTPDFMKAGEDIPVKTQDSAYASYSGGIGNVVVGEIMQYSDDSQYKNVIEGSIGIDQLANFSELTFRAYHPKKLKDYQAEYVFYVFHVAADDGSYEQSFLKRVSLEDSRSSYLERKEIGLPTKLGGEHDKVDYFGGFPFQLASGSFDVQKARYFMLESDNEVRYRDFQYLRISDLRRLQYDKEFASLTVTINVYAIKSDGERLMGEGTKKVYHTRSDGTIEEREVPKNLYRVEHYKFGEQMATGKFDILF